MSHNGAHPRQQTQTNGEMENHSTYPEQKWRIKSTLSVKAKQSGVYRCHATNKFPTSADADAHFYVSGGQRIVMEW